MHILVSGSTGLIGTALCSELMDRGHRVYRLVRKSSDFQAPMGTWFRWDPASGELPDAALRGMDAVVNLAGEPIVGWWTNAKKQRVLDSRVKGTALLAERIADMVSPPRVLINASATGYYGDRGDQTLDERCESGEGFLAEVGRRWEAATEPASARGVRVARTRFGIVLSPRGGALKAMRPVFWMGLGAPLGDGSQYWPWVSIDDAVGALGAILETDHAEGPFNVVGPAPVTNKQFTRALGRTMRRPTWPPIPEAFVNLLMGEMADQALLASQRAVPQRLEQLGYRFTHPRLEDALRALLGR